MKEARNVAMGPGPKPLRARYAVEGMENIVRTLFSKRKPTKQYRVPDKKTSICTGNLGFGFDLHQAF